VDRSIVLFNSIDLSFAALIAKEIRPGEDLYLPIHFVSQHLKTIHERGRTYSNKEILFVPLRVI
jgi:hypothetical protein